MAPLLKIVRSWLKQEGQLLPREGKSLLVAGLALLLLLPLGAIELRRRSLAIEEAQHTVRLQKLETVIAALSGTERTARDWGRWDNTYSYVAGRNPGFLAKEVASSALFSRGAVIAVFDRNGQTLLSFSNRTRKHPGIGVHPSLLKCAQDNLVGLNSLDDSIWLACRDQDGSYLLGVLTQLSNDESTAPTNGALVIFEPLQRTEYGPHLKGSLAALANDLRLQAGSDQEPTKASSPQATGNQLIPGPHTIYGSGRSILALRPESSLSGLMHGLLEDGLLLLAVLTPFLLARATVMLERRRQLLLQLRAERRSIRRVRRVCQQLDDVLERVGMTKQTMQPADRVMAKLLGNRDQSEIGLADSEAIEGRLEELARRFQRFLDGAKSLALIDGLTQLPNRRYFNEQLELETSRHCEQATSLAILFMDIDRFKDINDAYGHGFGDACLAVVARNLQEVIEKDDFLARYSSDEFAILIDLASWQHPDQQSIDDGLRDLAYRIGNQFEQPRQVEDIQIDINLSIGITVLDPGKIDKETALRNCDLALAEAKRNKHSRVSVFALSDNSATSADYDLYADLLLAIREHQLTVVFQPIVDKNLQLYAVEALARWQHPLQGWINPELFIALAERYRKINILGDELLRIALQGYAKILDGASQSVRLSVNISPSQLQDPSLSNRIEQQLSLAGFDARLLTIELTEQGIIEASATVLNNIKALRSQGIRLSLDDFGTGYSSLNLLNSLQPDEVKIDRSFVEAMDQDNYARQIVMLVSQMAPSMGLQLVAEGVGNGQCFELLQRHGIRHFQGFLFSPGVAPAEIRLSYSPLKPAS